LEDVDEHLQPFLEAGPKEIAAQVNLIVLQQGVYKTGWGAVCTTSLNLT
jgi:hypothetical protein